MTATVVVAPHPDDEVLGASTVLRRGPVTVVHVTDGVPPWTPPVDAVELGERRRRECEAAWGRLDADVAGVVRLGFGDLAAWRNVPDLVDALVEHLAGAPPTTVHVPAYQGGHPDHDATYVAAVLARRRSGDRHRWRIYGLYGYDRRERLTFGALDRSQVAGARRVGGTRSDIEAKAAALRCFTSQLRPRSVVQRWLDDPDAEGDAPLPNGLPPELVPCFYEEEFDFASRGVHAAEVRATLEGALAAGSHCTDGPLH